MATEEYFYDSLEEDDPKELKNTKYTSTQNANYNLGRSDSCIVNNKIVTIPLYGGEVYRDDLLKYLKQKQNYQVYTSRDDYTSCLTCLKSKQSKLKSQNVNTRCSEACSSNLRNTNEESRRYGEDSICSVPNGSRSFSSYKLYFGLDSVAKKNKREKSKNVKNKCETSMFDNNSCIFSKSGISTVDLEHLRSMSEIIQPTHDVKPTKVKYNPYLLQAPVLGSLGPDLESCRVKMERLKKQQEYGRFASVQNRVKVIQTYIKSKQNMMNTNVKQENFKEYD